LLSRSTAFVRSTALKMMSSTVTCTETDIPERPS
jgi:hypothetical protein